MGRLGRLLLLYPQPVTTKGKVGRFAMVDQEHGRYCDIFMFIPEERQVIRIAEGSGDNLLQEDIENGYVDYIYYAQHELRVDMPEVDGGMVLLEKPLRDKY